jgi:hypothetical protein
MKKLFALLTTLIAFLTIFATTTFAAASTEKAAVAASPYEGPLMILAFITLAIMIYLPLTDNN